MISRRNCSGFGLIEISLAIIVSALLGYFLLTQQLRTSKTEVAKIQADQLTQIADALNSYTDLYRRQLAGPSELNVTINGTIVNLPATSTSEGSKLKPTIANLVDLGLLPNGFQNRPVGSNGIFVTRLNVTPLNCSLTLDNCSIEGYVVVNQPITSGSNTTQYDGDIVGDLLKFIGGNGFVTLNVGSSAVSAGGNFNLPLDIDGNGNPDSSLAAGLAGIRVGALATRVDVRDPIAGIDFCIGNNATVGWRAGTLSQGGRSYGSGVLASATIGGAPAECSAQVLSDTPVGYRFIQTDSNTGAGGGDGGSVLLKCVFDTSITPPQARFYALTSCCQTGNQTCTPPAPAS